MRDSELQAASPKIKDTSPEVKGNVPDGVDDEIGMRDIYFALDDEKEYVYKDKDVVGITLARLDQLEGLDGLEQISRMMDRLTVHDKYFTPLVVSLGEELEELFSGDDIDEVIEEEQVGRLRFKDKDLENVKLGEHDGRLRFTEETYKALEKRNLNPKAILYILEVILAEACYWTLNEGSTLRNGYGYIKGKLNSKLLSSKKKQIHDDAAFVIGALTPFKTKLINYLNEEGSPFHGQNSKVILIDKIFTAFVNSYADNGKLYEFNLNHAPFIRFRNILRLSDLPRDVRHKAQFFIDRLEPWRTRNLSNNISNINQSSKNINRVVGEWAEEPAKAELDDIYSLLDGLAERVDDPGKTDPKRKFKEFIRDTKDEYKQKQRCHYKRGLHYFVLGVLAGGVIGLVMDLVGGAPIYIYAAAMIGGLIGGWINSAKHASNAADSTPYFARVAAPMIIVSISVVAVIYGFNAATSDSIVAVMAHLAQLATSSALALGVGIIGILALVASASIVNWKLEGKFSKSKLKADDLDRGQHTSSIGSGINFFCCRSQANSEHDSSNSAKTHIKI